MNEDQEITPISQWSTRDPRDLLWSRGTWIVVDMEDQVCLGRVSTKDGWSVAFVGRDRTPIGEDDLWPGYKWTVRSDP